MRPSLLATLPLLATLAGGCTVDTNAPTTIQLRTLDFNYFACQVQPVTAARCSMVACHGQADHAFRIYMPGKLRIDTTPTLQARDVALTLDEATANFASMRGLAAAQDPTEDSPLLRKPLAHDQGGGEHVGGVLFHDPNDVGYQTIKAWLDGATCSSDVTLPDGSKQNCTRTDGCALTDSWVM